MSPNSVKSWQTILILLVRERRLCKVTQLARVYLAARWPSQDLSPPPRLPSLCSFLSPTPSPFLILYFVQFSLFFFFPKPPMEMVAYKNFSTIV